MGQEDTGSWESQGEYALNRAGVGSKGELLEGGEKCWGREGCEANFFGAGINNDGGMMAACVEGCSQGIVGAGGGRQSREEQFMQAERVIRSLLYSERDIGKQNDMRSRVRDVLKQKSKVVGAPSCGPRACGQGESETLFNKESLREFRDEVKQVFQFSFDQYMTHAYPQDELKPLSCRGKNVFGPKGYRLTLIDALDTFVVVGNISGFADAVRRTCAEVTFDIDVSLCQFLYAQVSLSSLSCIMIRHIRDLSFHASGCDDFTFEIHGCVSLGILSIKIEFFQMYTCLLVSLL